MVDNKFDPNKRQRRPERDWEDVYSQIPREPMPENLVNRIMVAVALRAEDARLRKRLSRVTRGAGLLAVVMVVFTHRELLAVAQHYLRDLHILDLNVWLGTVSTNASQSVNAFLDLVSISPLNSSPAVIVTLILIVIAMLGFLANLLMDTAQKFNATDQPNKFRSV